MPSDQWPRNAWLEAVWSSELRPLERLVAAVYADHARDSDQAWITGDRLAERTGLSRHAAVNARSALVAAGWLREAAPAVQHRAAMYALAVPGVHVLHTSPAPSCAPDAQLGSPGVHERTPGVHERTSRCAPRAHNKRTDHRTNSSTDARDEAMERRNRYPVPDVASALAELDAHFGDKAGEALDRFLAYRDRIGKPIRNIGAFFARGIDGPLHERIRTLLPTPSPTELAALCPECGGGGWVLNNPQDPSSARKCTHTRSAAVG